MCTNNEDWDILRLDKVVAIYLQCEIALLLPEHIRELVDKQHQAIGISPNALYSYLS